ncbi:MAG: LamG domain-containing protein, partial [Halofilum sp. (in: g-proteobacteria)]|nr:LamG domain-containing protein [Halofilum sp. (in: g-proteobacteria)]
MDEPGWNGTLDEVGDSTGNGHAGTAVGGATTDDTEPARAGDPGTCGYGTFDGSDDGIDDTDAGAYLNGLSAVTVSAWVYNTAGLGGNDRGIFFTGDPASGKDHRLGIRYDNSGFNSGGNNVIKAGIQTTDCNDGNDCVQVETEPDVMTQNGWQHVAMTWVSGGDLRVYVNGQDVTGDGTGDLGQGTGGTIDAVNALNIGQGAKGDRWQGRLDEFRVWDQQLSAAQVQVVFQETHPCPVPGI